jgi:hypothetical protein
MEHQHGREGEGAREATGHAGLLWVADPIMLPIGIMATLLRLALALALFAAAPPSHAQPEAAAEEGRFVDPDALALARRAGEFLRDAKRFRFVAETGYEAVQEDGSKIEFGATRRYTVERPARVRVETEARDGGRRLALFDGKAFVQVDLDENAYSRADLKQPREIDFVIDLLRERLDSPVPLGELLRNDPRPALEDSIEAALVVGDERLRGVPCSHVALRNPDADVQLWIAKGAQPLVRRVVITYRTLEGEPSFWADLDEWSFPATLDAATFRFDPPAGAERVRLEVYAPPTEQEAAP